MSNRSKFISRVLSGTSDANISFEELRHLLISLEFEERICGSHHIFTKDGVQEIINLQPKGSNAKPYQVKQVRKIIVNYKLTGTKNDSI